MEFASDLRVKYYFYVRKIKPQDSVVNCMVDPNIKIARLYRILFSLPLMLISYVTQYMKLNEENFAIYAQM